MVGNQIRDRNVILKIGFLAIVVECTPKIAANQSCELGGCNIIGHQHRARSLLQLDQKAKFASEEEHGWIWEFLGYSSEGAQESEEIPATQILLHAKNPLKLKLPLGPYFPLLSGLREVFEERGLNVTIGDRTDEERFLELVAAAPKGSTWLISIGAVFMHDQSSAGVDKFFSGATSLGAKLVLYQSEPSKHQFDALSGIVRNWGVSEVWDYSRRNQHHYSSSLPTSVAMRLIPPGYASSLDFGVDVDSTEKNESSIAFLGNWAWRPPDVRLHYRQNLSMFLHSEKKAIWTPDEYRRWLTRYPIQLNVHHEQSCCPSQNAMEAFRMALLLSNKACVISAPVDSSDEETWRPFVRFSEPIATKASFLELMQQGAKRCRVESYNAYKQFFTMEMVLNRSGVFHRMGIRT